MPKTFQLKIEEVETGYIVEEQHDRDTGMANTRKTVFTSRKGLKEFLMMDIAMSVKQKFNLPSEG